MYFTKNRFEVKDAVEMFLLHESPKKYVEYMSFPEKEETIYKVKTKENKERVCRYSRIFQKRCANNYSPSDGKTSSACQKKIHQRRNKTSVKQFEDEKHDQSAIYATKRDKRQVGPGTKRNYSSKSSLTKIC